MVYVNEACNSKGSRIGIAIFTPTEGLIEQCILIAFPTTNNVVECEALLLVLRQPHSLEAKKVLLYSDSHLIVIQVNNAFEAKEEEMKNTWKKQKKKKGNIKLPRI